MSWSLEELERIDAHDELRISSVRADGTMSPKVIIWFVRVEDDLYVRSVNGAGAGWYRATRARHSGQIIVGGQTYEVDYVDFPAEGPMRKAIDAAYRRKYARYPTIVPSILKPDVLATTICLVSR